MIIKKYVQFLLRENKEEKNNQDWKEKFECKLIYYVGDSVGEELVNDVEDYVANLPVKGLVEDLELGVNVKEERSVIEGVIERLSKIENKYWNTTLSSFFTILVMLLLSKGFNNQGAIKIADEKLVKISKDGELKKSNKSITTMDDDEKDKTIKFLKGEISKEKKKLNDKLESNLKKYMQEKNKLEVQKTELETKLKDLKEENKKLKEEKELRKIAKRLDKLNVKISGKTPKG
jgi:hypothetical protein